ncbi:MAG: serine/threonine protein kinase, partial [Gemmatimonadetes bacterium]|nr:serine/threonine protein kinase [Gemmatimonadota bacterium]
MSNAPAHLLAALADRYRLERELGEGGMATVYQAHDLRHDRPVALKVLRPDLAASLGAERFHREIQIAARLQHPHILPVLDSGEAAGFLYFVMPFVEGESLRDRLAREGALPVGDAVRILRDVVDALTEAHANGVVHRDIKPENVLLRGRHALVADFGVAKAVTEAAGRQTLTTAGVALGTPAYMAPEQASADPKTDHRADLYAAGAVAYEMLTGRPVFLAATPRMMLLAHVSEAPMPISHHRESVPRALEAVVMRCLEKNPADRWQSAAELLGQVEALATPSGGVTPPETRPVAGLRPRRPLPMTTEAAGTAVKIG